MISGYSMDMDNATAITLRNLFVDIPAENIMQIVAQTNIQPQSKLAIKTLTLTPDKIFPLNWYQKLRKNKIPKKGVISIVPGLSGARGVKSRASLFFYVAAYLNVFGYTIDKSLRKEVEKFSPDLIYTLLGNEYIMKLVNKISSIYKLPIIPHFMDDWPGTRFSNNIFLAPIRKYSMGLLKKILNRSSICLTISKKMADEYEKKFSKKCLPLMNCVQIDEKLSFADINSAEKVFIYTGGLHLYRWESLLLVSEAIEKLASEGCDIKFEIYTMENDTTAYSHYFDNSKHTIFCSRLTPEALNKQLKTAFACIHAESFDSKAKEYTRLSISTKIPEYMAAARPIIAIGPKDIASIEHIIDNSCGLYCDASSEDIYEKIKLLINDEILYENISSSCWATANKYHSAKEQGEILIDSLRKSIENKINYRDY